MDSLNFHKVNHLSETKFAIFKIGKLYVLMNTIGSYKQKVSACTKKCRRAGIDQSQAMVCHTLNLIGGRSCEFEKTGGWFVFSQSK